MCKYIIKLITFSQRSINANGKILSFSFRIKDDAIVIILFRLINLSLLGFKINFYITTLHKKICMFQKGSHPQLLPLLSGAFTIYQL